MPVSSSSWPSTVLVFSRAGLGFMRSLKITAAILAAVALVCVPSAAVAAPVSTAASSSWQSSGVAMADGGYVPSKSKWRQYMLNVTSSILGAAAPKSHQREQIANKFAQNGMPDGDALNLQYGYTELIYDGATGKMVPATPRGSGTYDDVIIDNYEKELAGKGTRKPQTVPATAGKKIAKAVGAGATAYLGLDFGAMLGGMGMNMVGGWFGWDVNGTVCSQTAGQPGGELTEWVTGQDCSAWDFDPNYQPNADVDLEFGAASWNGGYSKYLGSFTYNMTPTMVAFVRCYDYKAPASWVETDGRRVDLSYQKNDGTWAIEALNKINDKLTEPYGPHLTCPTMGGQYYLEWSGATSPTVDNPLLEFRYRGVNGGTAGTKPTEPVTDPERRQDCTVTYTDGSTLTEYGEFYNESDGGIKPAQCPATPAGKTPDTISVGENGNGPRQETYKEETSDAFKEWNQQAECATGACLLDLLFERDGKWLSCFDQVDGCQGWFEDPAKDEKYKCRYGRETKDLAECYVYAGLFQPGRVEVGAPYSDPLTGNWSGGSNSTRPDRDAMSQTIQRPDANFRSCDGMNITGFDPVGFVMRPIQCALEWAFVPRPLVVESGFAAAQGTWDSKPPAVIAESVTALAPTVSGCSRSVTLFDVTFPVIDACSGVGADIAFWSRMVTGAAMVVLVLIVLRRQVAAMVNYNQGQG